MPQHPNAEILRAIADGKTVQWCWTVRHGHPQHLFEWTDWSPDDLINPFDPRAAAARVWRVKPDPEPLFERWYLVETRESTIVPALNYTVQRASMEGLVRLLQGNPDLKQNLVGFLCMSVDTRTVRKVEFFSKAELRAKGVL